MEEERKAEQIETEEKKPEDTKTEEKKIVGKTPIITRSMEDEACPTCGAEAPSMPAALPDPRVDKS